MGENVFIGLEEQNAQTAKIREQRNAKLTDAKAVIASSNDIDDIDSSQVQQMSELISDDKVAGQLVDQLSNRVANEVLTIQNIQGFVEEHRKKLQLLKDSQLSQDHLDYYQRVIAQKLIMGFGYIGTSKDAATERFDRTLNMADTIGLDPKIVKEKVIAFIQSRTAGYNTKSDENFRAYVDLLVAYSGEDKTTLQEEILQTETIISTDPLRKFNERVFHLYRLTNGLQLTPEQTLAKEQNIAIKTINEVQTMIDERNWGTDLPKRVLTQIIRKSNDLIKQGKNPDLWEKVVVKANQMITALDTPRAKAA